MNHVGQVAGQLVKLGFSDSEADHLAREKHRALSDTVKQGADPGKVAEEIVERETESRIDAREGVTPIDETAAEVDLGVVEVKSDAEA